MKRRTPEGQRPGGTDVGRDEPAASEVVVEEAQRSQFPAVGAVLILGYSQYKAVLPPSMFAGYMEDLLDLEGRARDSQLLVARRGDRLLGAVSFYPDASTLGVGWPPEGWAAVRALAVVPQARGMGVARQLMEACLARARQAGAPALGLHTAEFMTEAVRLYEGMGFRRASHFDFDVPPAGMPDHPPVLARAYLRLLG